LLACLLSSENVLAVLLGAAEWDSGGAFVCIRGSDGRDRFLWASALETFLHRQRQNRLSKESGRC
jgi:hypothetical protein